MVFVEIWEAGWASKTGGKSTSYASRTCEARAGRWEREGRCRGRREVRERIQARLGQRGGRCKGNEGREDCESVHLGCWFVFGSSRSSGKSVMLHRSVESESHVETKFERVKSDRHRNSLSCYEDRREEQENGRLGVLILWALSWPCGYQGLLLDHYRRTFTSETRQLFQLVTAVWRRNMRETGGPGRASTKRQTFL